MAGITDKLSLSNSRNHMHDETRDRERRRDNAPAVLYEDTSMKAFSLPRNITKPRAIMYMIIVS